MRRRKTNQKTKESKATVIFVLCLLGAIALVVIIGISAQIADSNRQKEEPEQPESCLRGVFYTSEKDGKLYFQPLYDGLCVKDGNGNIGVCDHVDGYGGCYDSNNNKKSQATIYAIHAKEGQ